jgi:hypothetical protein
VKLLRSLRILCLAILTFVAVDIVKDASAVELCGAKAAVCHACVCAVRLVSTATPVALAPKPASTVFPPYQSPIWVSIVPQSFFHPPKLSA